MKDYITIEVDRYLNEQDRLDAEYAPYESNLEFFLKKGGEFEAKVNELIAEAKASGDYEYWLQSGSTQEDILREIQEEVLLDSWEYQSFNDAFCVGVDYIFENYL